MTMTREMQQRTEPFSFSQLESGIVATDGAPSEAGAEWAEIWRFQLPAGYSYIFGPGSQFSAYLEKLAEVVDAAMQDDGGVITDDTIDARDAGADDVLFFPATQAQDDAFYVGYRYKFSSVRFTIGTQGTDLVWGETWEYYNGSTWAALGGLSATATTVFTDAAGDVDVSFTIPSAWAKTTVNGHNLYWVRCRLATVGTQATVDPLGTQITIHGGSIETELTDLVRVNYFDPNRENSWRLMGAAQYRQTREFQQESKLHHFDLPQPLVIPESYWIQVQVAALAPIDASDSAFLMTGHRVRNAIF